MTTSEVIEAERVAAVARGDRQAFEWLVNRYRRELQVHCYRMLGSFEDAEDLVQETFLRAWTHRTGYQGRSTYRRWLYRIATNACLDALRRRKRRVLPPQVAPPADPELAPLPSSDLPWLQPYPDHLLAGIGSIEDEPEAGVAVRETIELVFIAAIQWLTPRQRAVFVLRGVLGWSPQDAADLLDASVAAVNSSMQRARATLREHLEPRPLEWSHPDRVTDAERSLLLRYIAAHENADTESMAALIREDAILTMPPTPTWYLGRADILTFHQGVRTWGSQRKDLIRALPTAANRQPAAAVYFRQPNQSRHRAGVLEVLQVEDGLIAEITAFLHPELFPKFGLPLSMTTDERRGPPPL